MTWRRPGASPLGLAGLAAGYWLRPSSEDPEPVVLALTPGTSREASPAISPDGKFVAYLASEGGRTDVWVQFVGGGPAVEPHGGKRPRDPEPGDDRRSRDLARRELHRGSRGPPEQPSTQRGIWLIPAPLGGPPRKLLDRAGGLRWSADGSRIAYMRPDPASGDAILVARPDGADERVLVPPRRGSTSTSRPGRTTGPGSTSIAGPWGTTTLPPRSGACRAAAAPPSPWWRPWAWRGIRCRRRTGGPHLRGRPVGRGPQPLVASAAGRSRASPHPRCRGLHRAASLAGRAAPGCEARTSVGSLRVLGVREPSAGLGHALTGAGVQDAAPSTARNGRIAFSSARSGTQDIWTSDADGANARPLTSDPESDSLPAISPDGSRVAFVSDRGGRRGLWLVSADGGTPRSLAPVGRRGPALLVAGRSAPRLPAEGPDAQRGLWVVSADGGAPVAVPGVRGRAPAWSPSADLIAYFTSAPSAGLLSGFTTSRGESLPDHPDLSTNSVDSLAFSWNGRWLATGVSPGAGGHRDRRRGSRERGRAQRRPAAPVHGDPRSRLVAGRRTARLRPAAAREPDTAVRRPRPLLEHRDLHAALAGDVDGPVVAGVGVAHDARAGIGRQHALEARAPPPACRRRRRPCRRGCE